MEEVFKWIPGYENRYQISENGTIRSYLKGGRKATPKRVIPRLLIPTLDNNGYFRVGLRKEGERVIQSVHRLIGITFIPNPKNKAFINHKNGVKSDNRINNLEWNTREENVQHAYDNGLKLKMLGQANGRNVLTPAQVMEIFNSVDKHGDLAIKYLVSKTMIGHIKRGVLWKELTGKEFKSANLIKLTKIQIEAIYSEKGIQSEIGKKYGVRQSVISSIKTGRTHSKITGHIFILNNIIA